MTCCVWTEKENGKGNIYVPSCLSKSSKGVNVFKVAKKYNVSFVDIFRKCPFCGNPVVVNAIKKENTNETIGEEK